MNVSLTRELDAYVHGKVESGQFSSASEVVRQALRVLQEQDEMKRVRLEELRRKIQEGVDSADRGELIPFDDEFIEGIKQRGRERLAGQ